MAAVVEYHTTQFGKTNQDRLNYRTNEYVSFIGHTDAIEADIIVFPESTLTNTSLAQFIPDPNDHVVPCNNATYGNNPIQAISCAARDHRKYVVVNMVMKRICSEEQALTPDHRPCSPDNINLYNTNVVFDRSGAIISM